MQRCGPCSRAVRWRSRCWCKSLAGLAFWARRCLSCLGDVAVKERALRASRWRVRDSKWSVEANGVRSKFSGSKWGQIKIQDDQRLGVRNTITKFCSDPFCAVAGDYLLRSPRRAISSSGKESPAENSPLAPERVPWACAPDALPFGRACAVLKLGCGLVWYGLRFVPNFPCFQLKRPDWGAYPWHTLWREYRGILLATVTCRVGG